MLDPTLGQLFRPFHATSALILGLVALLASTCHLGRPLYAFRGILGLRHSWLSREILAFGIFAGMAIPYALVCWLTSRSTWLGPAWAEWMTPTLRTLRTLVAVTGVIGVFCSAMIYVFTKRELWSFERTMIRFALSAAVLGVATTWLSLLLVYWVVDGDAAVRLLSPSDDRSHRHSWRWRRPNWASTHSCCGHWQTIATRPSSARHCW